MQLTLVSLARHSLVWLTVYGWTEAVDSARPEHREILAYWNERDLPLIVRRQSDLDPPGCLYLGLSLPPSLGKLRVPVTVSNSAAKEIRKPLLLSDVVFSAPVEWQIPLQDLVHRLTIGDICPQVYGAFAWQHLISNNYVHAQSDVDLLIKFDTAQMFEDFTRVVHDWEIVHGKSVDGELLFPNHDAIAWREVKGNSQRVLIKSATVARLVSRKELKLWMSIEPELHLC
jgi:phosphoribosyl-dephospho-CoA transferase